MVKKTKSNTVLCIEDEADICNFACKVLTLEGYRCLVAKTEEEIFRLLNEEDINLVLLALVLVECDGWKILEKIKTSSKTSDTPVIIYTTLFGEPQQKRALGMGAADYLIKPLSADVLRTAVSRILPMEDTAKHL